MTTQSTYKDVLMKEVAPDGTATLDDASVKALAASGISGASQLQRAAQRYKAKYRQGTSRAILTGDSYAYGSGASVLAKSYWGLLSAELASLWTFASYGSSGRPLSSYIFGALAYGTGPAKASLLQIQSDDVIWGIWGLNDVRGINNLGSYAVLPGGGPGADPVNANQLMRRVQSVATWFMVPETSRVRMHTQTNSGANPAVTFYTPSTAWNHGGFQSNDNYSYCGVANCSITLTSTYGDLLIVRYGSSTGATGGKFTVTVDGTLVQTVNIQATYDSSWATDCVIIKLPTKAQHSVVLTLTVAGNLMVDSVDCVDTATDFGATLLYSTPGNLPDGTGLGWSNAGAPAIGATANSATGATVWLYNQGALDRFAGWVDRAMSELFELGFNVVNVRHADQWDITNMMNADNLHPNDDGHLYVANKFRMFLKGLLGQ